MNALMSLAADLAELVGGLELEVERCPAAIADTRPPERVALLVAARAVHGAVVAVDPEPVEIAADPRRAGRSRRCRRSRPRGPIRSNA